MEFAYDEEEDGGSPLMALPNEILRHIVHFADNRSTLSSLRLVSKKWCHLARDSFVSTFFLHIWEAGLERLSQFAQRPHLTHLTEDLRFIMRARDEPADIKEDHIPIFRLMFPRLVTLSLIVRRECPNLLRSLAGRSTLRTLSVDGFTNSSIMMDVLPLITPDLIELRLVTHSLVSCRDELADQLQACRGLKALRIAAQEINWVMKCRWPNLQKLNLYNIRKKSIDPQVFYEFSMEHPTVIDLTWTDAVCLQDSPDSFPHLKKLITSEPAILNHFVRPLSSGDVRPIGKIKLTYIACSLPPQLSQLKDLHTLTGVSIKCDLSHLPPNLREITFNHTPKISLEYVRYVCNVQTVKYDTLLDVKDEHKWEERGTTLSSSQNNGHADIAQSWFKQTRARKIVFWDKCSNVVEASKLMFYRDHRLVFKRFSKKVVIGWEVDGIVLCSTGVISRRE
ncbi:hypothetical protein PROFUN_06749 [Planoprotostelium fungivorum]|uniref:F-box domain-containing protein n=1 Tax=Planoprotostelium fungivorum TaxID=1890364 RepID=A0A2P6NNI4_9EUKA|nr:hypothetical protein PROFUN_06749 [Planoprotostelium fungivorum]